MLRKMLATATVAAVLGGSAQASGGEPYFIGLGQLPDGISSIALAVSDDGGVVVGGATYGDGVNEAFRWTVAEGMVGLGYLPGADPASFSRATDVSADGSVIVGTSFTGELPDRHFEAFRWTQETGMVGLGHVEGLGVWSRATCASGDGSVVAGVSGYNPWPCVAFRWTEADGMVNLGDLPGGGRRGSASGISADGAVIVGRGSTETTGEAWRWTEPDGMVGLGFLPDCAASEAFGVSGDGNTAVGLSHCSGGESAEAFRWSMADGMVGLGDLPGGEFSSVAHEVSGDGSVIVGYGLSNLGYEAIIWSASTGMRSLRDVLVEDLGLDLSGWVLSWALGISPDGKYIVGNGTNPEGQTEAWLAYLGDPIPCRGNLDGDGVRDVNDLTILLLSYGADAGGDLDGDGDTDLSDLAWFLALYGTPCLQW